MKAKILVLGFATLAVCSAFAEGEDETREEERDTFGKWHLSVGGAFNAHIRSHLRMRNLPEPSAYVVPSGSTKADAWRNANARNYDGGGYIAADDGGDGWSTENWKLPTSTYRGNGVFELDNAYQDVVGSSVTRSGSSDDTDPCQFGISVELARELWIHDEAFENRWGVDFAFAVSYFFDRDCYKARSGISRTDTVQDGTIRTDVNDPDAMYDYDNGYDSPVGGMYGHGNYVRDFMSPALLWENVGSPYDLGGPTRTVSSSTSYSAWGDYRELEMLFLLRPWYEITDWWRVFGEIGLGVSWGRFECGFSGEGLSEHEDFDQWDCYGVAGLGTALRYSRFTLSADVIARFWRDDLDVSSRYVNGSISRSDWGVRVMVGVEF